MLSNTWTLQCKGQDRRSASHSYVSMMVSSNGNIFRVTGPLWGESTGHQGIPPTKASDEVSICEQPSEFTARHREFNCLTQIRPDMSKLCLYEYFGEKRLCHKGVQLHQCVITGDMPSRIAAMMPTLSSLVLTVNTKLASWHLSGFLCTCIRRL